MALTNEESLYNFQKEMKSQQRKANVAMNIANIAATGEVPKLEKATEKKSKKKRNVLIKSKAADEVRLIDLPIDSSRRPSIAMVSEVGDLVRTLQAVEEFESSSDEGDDEKCDECRGLCIKKTFVFESFLTI